MKHIPSMLPSTLQVTDLQPEEVRSRYRLHHTAFSRRYVSRKSCGIVCRYQGRQGNGYAILVPLPGTTHSNVEYYFDQLSTDIDNQRAVWHTGEQTGGHHGKDA